MDNDGGFGTDGPMGDTGGESNDNSGPSIGLSDAPFGQDPSTGFDVVGLPPVEMSGRSVSSPSFGNESMDDLGMMFADPNNSGMSQGFSNDASNTAIPQDTTLTKFAKFFAQMAMNKALPGFGKASAALNTINSISKAPTQAQQQSEVGKQAVGWGKGAVMGTVATAHPAMALGLMAFNALTQGQEGTPNAMADPGTTSGIGGQDLLGNLASLYGNYRSNQTDSSQINSLSGMYGQDSPYAQMLRQQLSRRDAAGGRRSQYGPREVELQAKLAQMAAGNAPMIGKLGQQRNDRNAQGLAQLINFMNRSGATQGISNGIQGLFNPNDGQQQFNQAYGPAIDPYGAGSGWGQDTFSGMGQQPDYSMFGG